MFLLTFKSFRICSCSQRIFILCTHAFHTQLSRKNLYKFIMSKRLKRVLTIIVSLSEHQYTKLKSFYYLLYLPLPLLSVKFKKKRMFWIVKIFKINLVRDQIGTGAFIIQIFVYVVYYVYARQISHNVFQFDCMSEMTNVQFIAVQIGDLHMPPITVPNPIDLWLFKSGCYYFSWFWVCSITTL